MKNGRKMIKILGKTFHENSVKKLTRQYFCNFIINY